MTRHLSAVLTIAGALLTGILTWGAMGRFTDPANAHGIGAAINPDYD